MIIISTVYIDYPINKDTSEAKSTTDPVVKQAPFAPRRPTPIGDLNFLLDKRKKKYKSKHILNLLLILLLIL